jgi:hypothetical protein
MIATISFVPAVRPGEKYEDGSYKSRRRFLDVVVDGTSLWERLGKRHDMVSVLCVDFGVHENAKAVNRLLLKSEADLPNDRRSLFICAECGDLGCGAVTVSTTRVGETVVWSDFGYQNDYEPEISRDDYEDVGPFEFDRDQYESALLDAVAQLKSSE